MSFELKLGAQLCLLVSLFVSVMLFGLGVSLNNITASSVGLVLVAITALIMMNHGNIRQIKKRIIR